ncbi:MAG: cellulase family glycosylhydrolase [Treponema sp.]|nr:cellulase family glycosylhydrolase [Treponema sp.]
MNLMTAVLLALFLSVAIFTVVACNQNPDDGTKSEIEAEEEQEEEQKQEAEEEPEPKPEKKNDENNKTSTKTLDISQFSKSTKQSDGSYKINLNADCSPEWDESSIWFSELQDFSEYKYLILTYKNASNAFRFRLVYSDESSRTFIYGKNQNKVKVLLDSEKADGLKAVQIFSIENYSLTMQIVKLELSNEEENLTPVKDSAASGKFKTSLTAMELAKNMQVGWNLGNSLECYDGSQKDFPVNQGIGIENNWYEEAPTEEIIRAGIANGYKTIRIPVTWYNHLIDSDYTIDPEWMAHVKQVVDWAINAGYYIILNEHHSVYPEMSASSPIKHCEGYIVRSGDEEESKAFLKAVWTQICQAFNNSYDEHLIFETLNEPRNTNHEHEWNPLNVEGWNPAAETCEECKKDFQILNDYNQLVLDTIRASGGNNAKRFVMIPGIGTGRNQILSDEFKMPADSANSENRLLATIHWYPLSGGYGKSNVYSDYIKNLFNEDFARLNEKFCKKGIPVVVGEFGCDFVHTGEYKATIDDISNCLLDFARHTGRYYMPIVNWDCGNDASIDRKTLSLKTDDSQNILFPKIMEEWNKMADKEVVDFTDSNGKTECYSLAFYDDFDGSELDSYKWNIYEEKRTGNSGQNGTLYNYWEKSAVSVNEGSLVIEAYKTEDKLISGAINTKNIFEQSHGLYEIRFKCDYSSGLWYAFWLMDYNNTSEHIDGSAADTAEIDIFELVPVGNEWVKIPAPVSPVAVHDNWFRTAINYDGYESGHSVKASPQAPDVDSSFYGQWHTVKFLWSDDNYELYLDDKLQYVLKGSDYAGMCEGKNFIIISSEMSDWGMGGPLDESYYPSRFYVDYVKAYVKE